MARPPRRCPMRAGARRLRRPLVSAAGRVPRSDARGQRAQARHECALGGRERRALDDDRRVVTDFRVLRGHEKVLRGSRIPSDSSALRRSRRTGSCGSGLAEVQLAELDDHDAVVGEMFRLLDHLLRVEVALRQHERARRSRVRGGVAVGRDVPDEVVLGATAREVGASVTLVQVYIGPLAQIARVVGEVIREERRRDRVELDGLDIRRVIRERRQDLLLPADPMMSSSSAG